MARKDHPLYTVWRGMRSRCNSLRNSDYKWYGARGIRVCQRWDDFLVFVADIGERPAGATIDRIDNNGNYSPENCKWSTQKEQVMNSRKTIIFIINNRKCSMRDAAKIINLSVQTTSYRYKKYGRSDILRMINERAQFPIFEAR